MGLDWVVLPKRKEKDVDVRLIEKQLDTLEEEYNSNWYQFCEALGLDGPPVIFPNEYSDEFAKLPSTVEISGKMKKLQESLEQYYVSPEETLGVPRLGKDEAADQWVSDNWEDLNTIHEGKQLTKDEFIKLNYGKFVIEAADKSPGIAEVSGIFVSQTSFRGKVLRSVKWLDSDLQGRAYSDMEPDELHDYGVALKVAADEQKEACTESEYEDIRLVAAAGDWCIFWADNGHGMHAWY